MIKIIGEVGVSHNGNQHRAITLASDIIVSGADYVKFQIFFDDFINQQKGEYKSILQCCCFCLSEWQEIIDYLTINKLPWFATAFGMKAIRFLKAYRNYDIWKVPSGYLTNTEYLELIAKQDGWKIVSTGMATREEILNAYNTLKPQNENQKLTLLHCTTAYPTPIDEVNLNAIHDLKTIHNSVGFSDHTQGIECAIASVPYGIEAIEKHVTYNRNAIGPDHRASLEIPEFREMVKSIRNVERALGEQKRERTKTEQKQFATIRKRMVL